MKDGWLESYCWFAAKLIIFCLATGVIALPVSIVVAVIYNLCK